MKVENIIVKSASTTGNFMDGPVNEKFKKQRSDNPAYDTYLIELSKLLAGTDNEAANKIIDTINYKGKWFDIIRDIIPYINSLYNNGFNALDSYKLVLDGKWRCYDTKQVFESIELTKPFKDFALKYLNKLKKNPEILIETISLTANDEFYINDEVLDEHFNNTDRLVLCLVYKAPKTLNEEIAYKYWQKASINDSSFVYRNLIISGDSYKIYKTQNGKVAEASNTSPAAIILYNDNDFMGAGLKFTIEGDYLGELNSIGDVFDKAELIYKDNNKLIYNVTNVDGRKVYDLYYDLCVLNDKLNECGASLKIEGILTSYDEYNKFLNEVIVFKQSNGAIQLGFINI